MSRRPIGVVALVTAGLAAVAIVPFAGVAAAAACPVWTDGAGDASLFQFGLPATQDGGLDIVEAGMRTSGGNVVAHVKVSALKAAPSGYGDEIAVQIAVGGQDLMFYSDRTPGLGTDTGVWNLGSSVTADATATYDTATSTVTITATQAAVDEAAGKPVKGETATGLAAFTSLQADGRPVPSYDDSAAPEGTTYVVGGACAGGGDPTGSPTASPTVAPTTPPPGGLPAGYPTAGCNTFEDGTGDGTPDVPVNNAGQPVAQGSNDPDLDLTGLVLGSTDSAIVAFLRLNDLKAAPATGNGHQFEVTFTHNGKVVTLYTSDGDALMDAERSAVNSTAGVLTMNPETGGKVGTTYNKDLAVTAAFDIVNDVVRFSVTRASLAAVAGAPVPDGATFTDVAGLSRWMTPYFIPTADTVQHAEQPKRVYTVGNNPCFGPPPGKLVNTGVTTVQYGDTAALATKLTTQDGAALGGKTVTFTVGGKSATATTNGDGVATLAMNPGLVAGAHSLVTSFAGDSSAKAVTLTTPFAVTQEKTKVTLKVVKSGTKRTVTAKLVDDDGKPVVGQVVAWYVNGKKVASPRTNSSGVVTLTTAKPTQTVKAVFAAVSGKYLGATAQVKV